MVIYAFLIDFYSGKIQKPFEKLMILNQTFSFLFSLAFQLKLKIRKML